MKPAPIIDIMIIRPGDIIDMVDRDDAWATTPRNAAGAPAAVGGSLVFPLNPQPNTNINTDANLTGIAGWNNYSMPTPIGQWRPTPNMFLKRTNPNIPTRNRESLTISSRRVTNFRVSNAQVSESHVVAIEPFHNCTQCNQCEPRTYRMTIEFPTQMFDNELLYEYQWISKRAEFRIQVPFGMGAAAIADMFRDAINRHPVWGENQLLQAHTINAPTIVIYPTTLNPNNPLRDLPFKVMIDSTLGGAWNNLTPLVLRRNGPKFGTGKYVRSLEEQANAYARHWWYGHNQRTAIQYDSQLNEYYDLYEIEHILEDTNFMTEHGHQTVRTILAFPVQVAQAMLPAVPPAPALPNCVAIVPPLFCAPGPCQPCCPTPVAPVQPPAPAPPVLCYNPIPGAAQNPTITCGYPGGLPAIPGMNPNNNPPNAQIPTNCVYTYTSQGCQPLFERNLFIWAATLNPSYLALQNVPPNAPIVPLPAIPVPPAPLAPLGPLPTPDSIPQNILPG